VNSVGKNLPSWRNSQEYQLGLVQVWRKFCKNEELESNSRNVETYSVNSGQNNQKSMRFWGQPGRIHKYAIDFTGQRQQTFKKSIEI